MTGLTSHRRVPRTLTPGAAARRRVAVAAAQLACLVALLGIVVLTLDRLFSA